MHISIDVTAALHTPFNVGTGALGDAFTDKPTVKNGQQHAFIPGSAFKGRLRHTCERLLRALLDDDHAACHTPDPANTCPLDRAWLGAYCPICRLFGSPRRPGPLTFSDLHWQGQAVDIAPPTLLRTGVSIRRSRRVAEPQRLYNLEAVDALSIAYRGQISGHLPDADAQALVALLLGGVNALASIGGGRGSGLGQATFTARARIDNRLVDDAWMRHGLEEGVRQWQR